MDADDVSLPGRLLKRTSLLLLSALMLSGSASLAGTFIVTNPQDSGPGSLRNAIQAVNGAAPGPQVVDARSVTGTITLASSLPVVTAQGMTLLGPGPANLTIDGANQYQAFFIGVSTDAVTQGSVYETTNSQISISGLTIAHALTRGGAGGVNAGGGAGLGGALFVNAGNVVISNLLFIGNSAIGGAGGPGISTSGTLTQTGGGGGGLGGNGATGGSTTNSSAGGGGGGFGYGAIGSSLAGNVGTGSFPGGANGGAGGNYGTPGGINGGGGFGPPLSANGGGGGGGGVAGGAGQGYFDYSVSPAAFHGAGGAGGFGGGGGGGGGYQFEGNSDGGNGGFGGGGGAGQQFNHGGNGGFGGGAASGAWPGAAGFGGGSATNRVNGPSAGGGGLGGGGAIFVRQGANLTILDCNFSGNTVTGGSGGTDGALAGGAGSALGQVLFLGASVTNSVSGTNVVVLSDNIGGGKDPNAGGGLVKIGSGTLVLAGTNNYVGPTTLAGGVLQVGGDISASSNLTVGSGTMLTGGGTAGETVISSGGTVAPGPAVTALGAGDVTWNGSGNFNWKLYDAVAAPGAGYDVLNAKGVLDLTGATSINLNLWSLSSASPVTTGNAIHFNNAVSHSWTLVHTTDGVIRFNPSKFNINTAPNNGAGGFSNPLGSGTFSLAVVGTDLVLQFVVPLSVVTQPASNVTAENATLNAAVNPNGAASAVYFEWGTTTSYGSATPITNVGTGISVVAVSDVLSNLQPGVTYHYQAVATNNAGVLFGGDVTFTALRTNAALAGVMLSSGPIAPAFDPGTTTYSTGVGNAIANVTVTPTSADNAATIQMAVNGGAFSPVSSGSASGALALNVGANTIAVTVTAQDGVTTRTYTLAVSRAASSNAALAGLTLNAGPIAPAFDPSIASYTATVSNSYSGVTITPTSADNTATILAQINGGPLSAVPSGNPSGTLPLNVGGNVINVIVTAQDGVTTQTYTLTVNRVGSPQATTLAASGIAASNATLNASVIANGLATTAYFEWGTTAGYGNLTTPAGVGSGTSPTAVNVALTSLLPGATYHFAIIASNNVGTVSGADSSFTIPARVPEAATLPATGVTSGSATLNATVNPNGAATSVYFQWGTNTGYGNATALTSAGSGNNDVPINIALGSLLPGTTYHFTVVASNSVGVVTGADGSFTTPASTPMSTSLPASGIAASNATLNATVNPDGAATTVYFAWGITTSYGNTTGQAAVGSGTDPVAVSAPIASLLPGTTYHCALIASNSMGVVTSADATFTTPALAPLATALAASGITSASATLNATVTPNGAATFLSFTWGTNTSYGSTSSLTSAGSGNGDVAINIALGSLLPGTTYHFTVVASNNVGVVTGADIAFTTPPSGPVATTLAASGIGPSNATLNATVNPNGAATFVSFTWGTNTSYGSTTALTAAGSGNNDAPINVALGSLLPGTTYHYAVVASNTVGMITGADVVFMTPSLAPSATTLPATGISVGNATLNGSVNPNGAVTSVYFQWGATTAYGNTTAVTAIGSGLTTLPVSAPVSGFAAGVAYHYRVVADNGHGTIFGADHLFGAPSLTLDGPNPLTNQCRTTFTDPGATATGFVGLAQASISAGTTHSLALQANGTVVGWGSNVSGESNVPTGVSNVVSIAAGNGFSLVLLSDGTAIGWGTNGTGQASVPAGLSNVVSIAAGSDFGLALQGNGTLTGWGNNSSGQISVPLGLSNVAAIAAGNDFALALQANGTVVGWGNNSRGQTSVPAGLNGVIVIAAGASHSLALRGNGTVVGWGDNTGGETSVPAGLNNVVAIAAGNGFSLALESNGTVVAWGTNSFGQIDVPAGLNNVVAIAAGNDFALALQGNGTVVAWGDDGSGQTDTLVNLVAALPQEPILGNLTSQIAVSGTIDVTQLGVQQLTYTVVDALGTTNSATRAVVVADTTPPQIIYPQDILRAAAGQDSLVVDFPTPAAQDKCTAVSVVCTPLSGSAFPAGTNLVTCVATDTSSNSASCSFRVIVDVPPVVSAGLSQLITLPQTTVQLNGSVTEGGLLNRMTMAWSKLSGPGSVAFGNAARVTTSASFSTNGTYVLELTAGDGLASATSQVTIVVHAPPVITQAPTATGALTLDDGRLVLPSGEPINFTVDATEEGGSPLTFLWNFGDGATSTNQSPSFTFTNCQSQTVTVTVSDGISATNQSVAVQPACAMRVNGETVKVHFHGKQLDKLRARGFMNLPADFEPAGVQVAIQAGNVQQIFRLDVKGNSANAAGSLRVHHNIRKGWAFTVNFKGVFAREWAGNGLTNTTVRNAIVQVPLFFIFDTDPLFAYTSSPTLRYTAINGKHGTATK